MKVILIDWNAYGNAFIEELFKKRGYDVRKFAFDGHAKSNNRLTAAKELSGLIGSFTPDYVFSYHYFPDIIVF